MSCRKCHKPVRPCPVCKGGPGSGMFGKLTCSTCNNTGYVCDQHHGYWK